MFIAIHTFLFSIAHCPFEELIEQIYDTLMETNIVNEKVVAGILWYYLGGSTGGSIMVGICTNVMCFKEELFSGFSKKRYILIKLSLSNPTRIKIWIISWMKTHFNQQFY